MFDSVRTRIALWQVGILAMLLIAFAGTTYLLLTRVLNEEIDENLESMTRNIKAAIDAEREENAENSDIEKDIREVIRESRFDDYDLLVYDDGNREIATTFSGSENLTDSLLSLNGTSNAAPDFTTVRIGRKYWRVHSVTLEYGARKYRLLVLYSPYDQMKFLGRLRSIYFVAIPLALILTGFGGYFLARQSLAPVVDMSRQAALISATNLHERLPVKNEKDELGKLARIFNALLWRLEDSFERQRRFMADASHELRTPLAIVRGESEVALSREDRPTAELRESLAIVHDESKRLTKIVEDLFTLARADSGQTLVDFADFYLDEMLADCVRAVQILAEKKAVSLKLDVAEEMPLRGSEQLLYRLFLNLLDNAIKYNRGGGTVTVRGDKVDSGYLIRIEDTGTGIPPEEQEKIFERFYRADRARSRDLVTLTSGSGLGLSIARWIAELHHGSIEVALSNQNGSVFAVFLPLDKTEKPLKPTKTI